ncbi:DUF5412 family protein [Halobacillus sp. A5]|uniref:DUF5412 family protein n=1 Tax=Halobacillus sp. A5 TaxID=2880263 RepID=UPI0020A64AE5|nr:DUF5412 family protein [Halobacillus sp. A5]MCP3026568.1 DUF5412 domain-containing protein [Halobacillus sp. A5]
MFRKLNAGSFILLLVCLILYTQSVYSHINQTWLYAPPAAVLFLLSAGAFIFGVVGLTYKKNWRTTVRSWFTIIVSFLLSGSLLLTVLINSPNALELVKVSHSPDGSYELHIYRTNGGATASFGTKAKIFGPLWFEKTVYSNSPQAEAKVTWKNKHEVTIGQHNLNLEKGESYRD